MSYTVRFYEDMQSAEKWWRFLEEKNRCYYFQTFLWNSIYQETVGKACNSTPLIAVAFKDEEALAVFPFCLQRLGIVANIVRWQGFYVSDYSGPLFGEHVEAGEKEEVAKRVFDDLQLKYRYDLMILNHNPEVLADGAVNPVLCVPQKITKWNMISVTNAPFSKMQPWESYYATINKKVRSDSGRQRKRLAGLGAVEFVVDSEMADKRETTNVALLQKSKRYGNISEPVKAFYVALTEKEQDGKVVHSSRLTLNKRTIAAHWGILFGNRFYYLLPSFDYEFGKYSTGRLLLESLIQWSFMQDVGVFDFCIGEEIYKQAWAKEQMKVVDYSIPRTVRGKILEKLYRFKRSRVNSKKS